MDYNFQEIERKWQTFWKNNKTFKTEIEDKPKYYVLDMFPYPSGAGLHVGHPLGYIASDIFSRYKRLQGFNVLHPMGYDAFGLPAEQFAIQTGKHPAKATDTNIKRYREQLDKIGFSYDWSREVRTCDPNYYKWTQWAFLEMFKHWYNNKNKKAEPIEKLIQEFETAGNLHIDAACSPVAYFTADDWKNMTEKEQQEILLNYRLAYLADTTVNWCEQLGTVLANDEVKDGISVRGGHPVIQKKMKQWSLRVTAYAERLLNGLDTIEWTESLKELQRNWIGRSDGAQIFFPAKDKDIEIEIFTTRPDTIYGSTFMVLAPESDLVEQFTTPTQKTAVTKYVEETLRRSERERMTDVKTVTGVFSGSYAVNPFTKEAIPIWISDYVLAGYGTGAIMAVPAHDSRDFAFARHFELPILPVIKGGDISEGSYDDKEGIIINSGIINGMEVKQAIETIINEIEKRKIGKRQVNYRLRDAIFSRQRYWGEPFPIYYKDSIPYPLDYDKLPLTLPEVDKYEPTPDGQPPLARAENWNTKEGYPYELSTMPGFAGSSAYYLRYMDPHNNSELVSEKANNYWKNVDLYIGGIEHATGHLIYSRFWNKFLYDIGKVCEEEPFQKLINQGMIQGRSNFVYRANNRKYALTEIWDAVKDNKMGYKFKRDYRLNNDIYNFACEEKKIIIEVTSRKSAEKFYTHHDNKLQSQSWKLWVIVIEDVVDDKEKILNTIKKVLEGEAEIEHDFSVKESPYTPLFISYNLLKPGYDATQIHVDVNIVENDILDIDAFRKWRFEYENAAFVLEDGQYICGTAIEKMSKSLYNVVNPDDIVEQYGADTLRMYEMFLGPIDQSKPWNTNGIDGVHKFLRKFWKLFHNAQGKFELSDDEAGKKELKVLHKTIKKVREDIENFSFNTSVSAFMICVNELSDLKCNKRAILEPLTILLSPFAPHICEELWQLSGHTESIVFARLPEYNETYLKESEVTYPVSFNGKRRFEMQMAVDASKEEIEKAALEHESAQKWLAGKQIIKVIVVPKKIVNIVIKDKK